ncbi:MAG: hypothetical protein KDB32_09005 [Planctomycetes bacterium]|nr:hypothetical protein [Planctomycetota bacterium]MCA8945484.1 hypothetical protein [Planctomycetota bacterium]
MILAIVGCGRTTRFPDDFVGKEAGRQVATIATLAKLARSSDGLVAGDLDDLASLFSGAKEMVQDIKRGLPTYQVDGIQWRFVTNGDRVLLTIRFPCKWRTEAGKPLVYAVSYQFAVTKGGKLQADGLAKREWQGLDQVKLDPGEIEAIPPEE